MSKPNHAFSLFLIAFLQILQFFTNAGAQDIEAKIKIEPQIGSIVSISGKNPIGMQRNFSFLLSRAGIENLADRISEVSLFDKYGKSVTYKKFIAGEYVADADFVSWSYKIDLTPFKSQRAAAHVSWLTAESGILMLDDLLPKFGKNGEKISAGVDLEMPVGWRAFSDNRRTNGYVFESADVEMGVIFAGKGLLELPVAVAGASLQIIFDGEWNFTHDEARESAREIYNEYRNLFGSDSGEKVYIALMKFPVPVNPGIWEAETRGRNVTVISSDMPFKSQAVQRLHEQLRHEIFHLWLPNGVNLSGNYDWFYEGFALYQSLKSGVQLNRVGFNDFLDTLSQAHNIDNIQPGRISLIEVSKNRWSISNRNVYARGMLVAFLCDLAILEKSRGRKSVQDIFRAVFEKHRYPNKREDGNTAVLNALEANGELLQIIEKYVKGVEKIDWLDKLPTAGIENEPGISRTKLRVKEKLNGRQKALLDKLGYNSWRKLSRKSK